MSNLADYLDSHKREYERDMVKLYGGEVESKPVVAAIVAICALIFWVGICGVASYYLLRG